MVKWFWRKYYELRDYFGMKVWIDKEGGRHFHKEHCPMVNDPMFHYEAVEVEKENLQVKGILIEGKLYVPCLACFSEIYKKR